MKKYTEQEVISITRQFFDQGNPDIYFTMGGSIVVILSKNAGGDHPWLGAWFTGDSWKAQQWSNDGKIVPDESRKLDLLLPNTSEKEVA